MPKQRSAIGSRDAAVRQTILETLEAPRFCGISTEEFVDLKTKREFYEGRVKEKNDEQGVTPTSYLNLIDESVLEMFVLAQLVTVQSVADLTGDDLKKCVMIVPR